MSTTKYSIIIPTLWKSNRIHKLLRDLIKCQFVDEIILIDNAGKFFEYYEALDKVKLVQAGENIYVNPAWNLGIKIAKNNCVAILNDDINFNPNKISKNELVSILTFYGHHSSTTQKKNDLVNMFNKHISKNRSVLMKKFHNVDPNTADNIKVYTGTTPSSSPKTKAKTSPVLGSIATMPPLLF